MTTKICPSCKIENNPDFNYCWKCGVLLSGAGIDEKSKPQSEGKSRGVDKFIARLGLLLLIGLMSIPILGALLPVIAPILAIIILIGILVGVIKFAGWAIKTLNQK